MPNQDTSKPKKVLIVDDEPSILISLEFLMQQKGYDLRTAKDGEQAWQILCAFKPDLVLLDVMLPICNGFELCQRIRETPELADMKIILLTAKGRSNDVEKGLAAGANAYITKPFSIKDVTQHVEELLNESL